VWAGLVGGTSLLLFGVFLVAGPLDVVDLALGELGALALDGALCLAFFVQHSVMVRPWFRDRLKRIVPAYTHGAIYTVASGVVLLVLVVAWQESSKLLLDVTGPMRWVLRGLVFAAVGVFVSAVRSLGHFDAFGVNAALAGAGGTAAAPEPLTVRGAYRWVRHPLYLTMLMVLWSFPTLTLDRLLFNASWTVWVVFGTMLEERDLAAAFGDPYRNYQSRVPMLIPWRIPRG
jgi:protein-S-isoprenylcysteine O-methyltransferase Ste14